jgi:hypothetical protein
MLFLKNEQIISKLEQNTLLSFQNNFSQNTCALSSSVAVVPFLLPLANAGACNFMKVGKWVWVHGFSGFGES